MIGISIAAREEWESVKKILNITNTSEYPFGEFFKLELYDENLIFYKGGVGNYNVTNSTNYMINKFKLNKIIVIGTCAGISEKYKILDIILPNRLIQYDFIKNKEEIVLKEKDTILIDINCNQFVTGTIGTSDNVITKWSDYLILKNNKIEIVDMESASIAILCKINNIECVVLKGISDFPKREKKSEQINNYDKNVPIVMRKILKKYLELAIKNHFSYLDNSKIL